ncbi:MAG: hypothetical protein M3N29_08650 [Chloroflexota bacterium]|nr:hypothetical protein [Chloroflexota bacterium]
MPHPTLGLPPRDATAGLPAAAGRLRASRRRIARLALENTVRLFPAFSDAYDEDALRLFLRDYERHIEQLARALETGDRYYVTHYAEWLVPVLRRRRVPMKHFIALLRGLRDAAATVLTPAESEVVAQHLDRAEAVLQHHRRLPGDHPGNPIVRFFWKGAGILDDEVV